MDRRENLRRSAAARRGKMRGRTYLHVQSRGLQAVGAGRFASENMRAINNGNRFGGRRFSSVKRRASHRGHGGHGGELECSDPKFIRSPNRIEFAPGVVFIASSDSGWMTGETLYVTGGLR